MSHPKMDLAYASTYEELFQKRQYLKWSDIATLYSVGKTKACEIIQAIKKVSDIAHIAGRVTISDYIAWYNQHLPKEA